MEGGLNNFELIKLANYLHTPNFRGVSMRDTLPTTPNEKECGLLNLNTSKEGGLNRCLQVPTGAYKVHTRCLRVVTYNR